MASKSARRLRLAEVKEGATDADIVSASSLVSVALKAGYLMKRSEQGFVHNWKKRWVVLLGAPRSTLFYFEDNTAIKPTGVIPLFGAVVDKGVNSKFGEITITILTKANRVFYFQGATSYDTASWFEVLSTCPGLTVGPRRVVSVNFESLLKPSAAAGSQSFPDEIVTGRATTEDALRGAGSASTWYPPRGGPRALDPIAELGVSSDVVASISELNEEVRTAWAAVLAAALRSRGLEQMQQVERELAVTQAEVDTARIAALEADVAMLSSKHAMNLRVDRGLRSDVLHELNSLERHLEDLRADAESALASLAACDNSEVNERLSSRWGAATRVVLRDMQDALRQAAGTELHVADALPCPLYFVDEALASLPGDVELIFRAVKCDAVQLVARKTAEVLALKSALRDSGLPIPATYFADDNDSTPPIATDQLPIRRAIMSVMPAPPPNKPAREVLRLQQISTDVDQSAVVTSVGLESSLHAHNAARSPACAEGLDPYCQSPCHDCHEFEITGALDMVEIALPLLQSLGEIALADPARFADFSTRTPRPYNSDLLSNDLIQSGEQPAVCVFADT